MQLVPLQYGGGTSQWSDLHASLLVRNDPTSLPNAKIAAFDLDDTLQKTKSGNPGYMAPIGDFMFWSPEVAPKLRKLHAAGYKIVIFTNQGGVKGALQGKRAVGVVASLPGCQIGCTDGPYWLSSIERCFGCLTPGAGVHSVGDGRLCVDRTARTWCARASISSPPRWGCPCWRLRRRRRARRKTPGVTASPWAGCGRTWPRRATGAWNLTCLRATTSGTRRGVPATTLTRTRDSRERRWGWLDTTAFHHVIIVRQDMVQLMTAGIVHVTNLAPGVAATLLGRMLG
jgi:hypothetical protein